MDMDDSKDERIDTNGLVDCRYHRLGLAITIYCFMLARPLAKLLYARTCTYLVANCQFVISIAS